MDEPLIKLGQGSYEKRITEADLSPHARFVKGEIESGAYAKGDAFVARLCVVVESLRKILKRSHT